MHAPDILADTGKRLPERRINNPADKEEHDHQHGEDVKIVGVTVEVVIEDTEQRLESQARQAVITAGNVRAQVTGLLQQDRGREREHQQGESAIAQQEPPGDESDQPRRNRGRE